MIAVLMPQRWVAAKPETRVFSTDLPRVFSRYGWQVKKRLQARSALHIFAPNIFYQTLLMTNPLILQIFSAEKIQELLTYKPSKIVVRSNIEEAVLEDGTKAGVVRVYADAYVQGKTEPVATVTGCPYPPCN